MKKLIENQDIKPAYAIFATVKQKPGCASAYMPLIQVDAETALKEESGCQFFHILASETDANTVHLYEVYDTEEAFRAHQKSAYFLHYVEATKTLVEKRIIQSFQVASP